MTRREQPPRCPNCKGPMHQIRVAPRAGALAERTYECSVCRITVTEPAQPPVDQQVS